MSLDPERLSDVRRLRRLGQDLKNLFVNRDLVVELMGLALVCREHMLLLGQPGSGKSELVLRYARGIRASAFHYLLTRFTEPAELFGPLDLAAFREEKRYRIATDGMLPAAEVAFLDEVFQASSAILNTLLSVIHERIFHNGREPQRVPLLSLFAAANALPDDPTLAAFTDRFVLRVQVEPVPDTALGDLIDRGWLLEAERIRPADPAAAAGTWVTPQALARLHAQLPAIGFDRVRVQYIDLVRRLRAEGVVFSERRLVKGIKLIRAAALLAEREQATTADFWPLNHIWNTAEEMATLIAVVQPLVDEAGGPSLASHRPIEDITADFELLRSRQPDSESAWVAHLGALADLRRELLLQHAGATDLLGRVAAEIAALLDRPGPGRI